MRKVCIILAGIFLSLLFTTCKQFTADIDDYLSYWSTVVSSAGYSIDKPTQTSADGSMCVPSVDNLTVTVKLNNPKNVRLIMPDKGNVIHFPGLSTQPVYGTDYTLEQKTSDTLTLKYKSTFLRAHEWSNGDIGPEITLTADDGRVFKKKFSINLKVNTAPVLESAGIAKAQVGSEWYYVLLFRVKDMDSTITGSSVHNDITALNVTAGGGTPVDIPLTFNSSNTDFATHENLLGAANDIDTDSPIAHENWVIRLKTDVKVGEAEKEYAVSIKDAQGLSSAVIRTSTKKNKLPDVQLFNGSTSSALEITAITESAPVSFPGISGKTLTAKALDGALITGTVYKQSGGAWIPISGGTVSGTTTAAVNLPALAASGTEALYKISLKAQLSGYDDSDSKDFFVKLLWQEVPVLKLKQNFSSGDINLHCISAGTKAYVTEDIIPDAGQYTAENPLLIYTAPFSNFKLELSASAGTAVKYKLGSGAEQSPSAPAEITVIGGTVYPLEVWTERGGIPGLHTTVHIKGFGTLNTYSELKNVVKNAPENGTGPGQYDYSSSLYIFIGSDLAASAADTEIAVTDGKKLMLLSSSSGTVGTVNAGGNGRIFKVSGAGTMLTLSDLQVTGGYAADGRGGAVCVEAGGALGLDDKTVITPSTGADINTPGKNDVYLANGTSIKVDSTLTTTEPIVARITPQTYSNGNTVLTGNPASVSTNYTKFSVTQPDDGFLWTIKSDGTLKKISAVINGTDSNAWDKLLKLVQDAPEGSTITINGEIKATSDSGNSGEIVIDKNLTIKGGSGAVLNANSDSADGPAGKHRIFNMASGVTLTLENLTLKNGKAAGYSEAGYGGAVYTKGGSVEMTLCTLIGNEAGNGGAVYAEKDGSTAAAVTLKGCTIGGTETGNANAATTGADREGGGIYIGEGCTLILEDSGATGCTVKGNNARRGGGIYVAGTAEIKGTSKILNNTADHFGGGIHSEGTLILSGDALIKGNSASDHSALGGGVYVGNGTFTMSDRATVTPSTGENADKPRENDVYLNSTTKIKVDGSLTPQGGTAARITVPDDKYLPTTQVLTGSITAGTSPNQNYTKFTVTPQTLSDGKILYWEVDAAGKLMGIVDGTKYPNSAWKALKDAVDNATAGETIFIRGTVQATADTSTVTGNSGDITINKNLTIKSESETSIGILDANKDTCGKPKHRIFKVESGKTLTIQNLTLTGGIADGTGEAGTGGAIYAKGATVNINGCTLKGNEAKSGGAICAEKDGSTPSNVTITGGTIGGTGADANKATASGSDEGNGGGIYIGEDCTLTMKAPAGSPAQGVQVIGNTAVYNGAGIYTKGNLTMEKCTITDNKTTSASTNTGGGGVYVESGIVEIKDETKIYHNYTSASGGGIWINNGTLILKDNAEVIGNTAQKNGGGIALDKGGTLTLSSGKISGNTAQKYGGGICIGTDANTNDNTGTVTMSGGEVSNNTASEKSGGGVAVLHGTFTMSNGKVSGNTAKETGGGIYGMNFNSAKGEITVSGGEISGNTANIAGTLAGGGIRSSYKLTVSGGTIKTNKTTKPSGWGGGISVSEEFTFLGGTVVGNTCPGGGTVQGTGIHVWNCSVKMSGSAKVDTNNDIYLSTNIKITVIAPLTGTDPVARITPETYNTSTQVLLTTAGTGVTLANETYKFAVTPKIVSGTPQQWTVGGNGCLKEGRYTEVPYGKLAAFLANASENEVNYIEVTDISAADLTGTYGTPSVTGALGQKIKDNPSKKVALKLPSGLSGIDMSACFAYCKNLVSLENFPSNVTNMRSCFYDCQGLTTVPAMLTGSGSLNMELCFYNCKNLVTAPDIPAGVFVISRCFQNCKKLQSVKMHCPYNSGIGNFSGAFSGCALPDGGIKVPLLQLAIYKNNAGTMGTTKEKFSAIP